MELSSRVHSGFFLVQVKFKHVKGSGIVLARGTLVFVATVTPKLDSSARCRQSERTVLEGGQPVSLGAHFSYYIEVPIAFRGSILQKKLIQPCSVDRY
jgi:hypothetical protein